MMAPSKKITIKIVNRTPQAQESSQPQPVPSETPPILQGQQDTEVTAKKVTIKIIRRTEGGLKVPSISTQPSAEDSASRPPKSGHCMVLRRTVTTPSTTYDGDKLDSKPSNRKRKRSATDDGAEDAHEPDLPTTKMNPNNSLDSVKGKLFMWFDPTKPTIAHYWFEAEPCRGRTQFIAPPEAHGHKVHFCPRHDSYAVSVRPSQGYTVKWKVDVGLPIPAGGSAAKQRPKRRFTYHVHGVGRVRHPPVNPRTTCQIICWASPCEDRNAPLLPLAAEGHEVKYFARDKEPSLTPPDDSRPACRLAWTISGTEKRKPLIDQTGVERRP